MNDTAVLRRHAVALMREAIAMLDEAGEGIAAAHLQMAIDVTERIPPMKPGDEMPDESVDTTSPVPPLAAEPTLVRAIGGALAIFATLLARQGGTSVDEISHLLGIYALATQETSADEGLIIASWGAILRDVAEGQRQ